MPATHVTSQLILPVSFEFTQVTFELNTVRVEKGSIRFEDWLAGFDFRAIVNTLMLE